MIAEQTLIFVLLCALILCPSHQADVSCNDPNECINQVFNETGTIRCYGDHSCTNTSITFIGDLNCEGAYSCFDAVLLSNTAVASNDEIACQGLMSCSFVNRIRSLSGGISCNGELSCVDSNLYSNLSTTDSISCLGDRSCMNSILHGRNIVFYGSLSGLNSIVYANSSFNSSIAFYGNQAGYNSTIICGDNTTCSVDCQTNACNDLTFQCETESQCIMDINCDGAEESELCPDGTCFVFTGAEIYMSLFAYVL